jgi:hypothetical protein
MITTTKRGVKSQSAFLERANTRYLERANIRMNTGTMRLDVYQGRTLPLRA